MYQLVYYLFFVPLLIYGLYFFITSLFSFLPSKKFKKCTPKHKFAFVVAARNEAQVIGHLLDSFKAQDYPKELFDMYVIPNNCTDNTEQVAVSKGAKILKYKEKITSKGDALKLAFNSLLKEDKYDAYLIFDADNVVDKNFVREMNNCLCAGHEVAQGCRDTKNPRDSWISSSYALFYWTQNLFFGKSRYNLGLGSNINGTGFMVKTTVLKRHGFNTLTMTEDIEFTAQCALNKVRVVYVPEAKTYDEQPLAFKESWKQRKRWSIGTIECCYVYTPKLLRQAIKTNDLFCLDMGLFFLAPFVQIIGSVLFVVLIIYNMNNIYLSDITTYFYAYRELFFIITYIISILLSLVVLKMVKKSPKDNIKGILLFTWFMFTWLPINIMCLFKKDKVWEPIKHHRSITIDSIK